MTFAEWEWKKVKALRQWVRDFNKLAEAYGHEDAAGTPDEPDQYFVVCNLYVYICGTCVWRNP